MYYSLFASESVGKGHPDKVCDQISDAVLDACLSVDHASRVACETLVTTEKVVMAGEVTCSGQIDFEKVAREKIADIGYTNSELHFTNNSSVEVYIHQQSADISMGVDDGGAGDQGMMFGYACRETENFMPMPISMSHDLCKGMDDLEKAFTYLRPDAKAEVAIKYQNGVPKSVESIVLAKPHSPVVSKEEAKENLYKLVVMPVCEKYKLNLLPIDKVIFNGTDKWEIGGPATDTGVTGRKIIVDTYGGMARIGGGAFSGKDPTKVDRSAAYAARYIAKNIVAAGLADRCEIQLAYAIGYRNPIAQAIETFGTAKKEIKVIEDFAWKLLDLSVGGIIEGLDLRKSIYQQTAKYGHFGNPSYPWEKIK